MATKTATKLEVVEKTKESGTEFERAAHRKERMQRLEASNKITFSLQTDVRKFLASQARAEGMDMGHFMQKLVETHVLDTAPPNNPLAVRIAAQRGVIDHVVKLARSMDGEGAFDDHFILKVMKRAGEDPVFASLYEKAVVEDEENPRRTVRSSAALNQQLARLIKRAVGAKSKRDEAGKIMRTQVKGEILTSYTLLDKPAAA